MGKGKGRRRGASKWQQEHRPLGTQFLAPGGIAAGRVQRRDGEYHLRHISAAAAAKDYSCPGCGLTISAGTAHVVAWRADSVLGDEFAASERRHWHSHCWRISS
ncbi:hypothetical protein [Nesterenkonia alkaliphila]|uniref:hypothetical protein n=1 Tax=Nesterenkonia alkaliphila TaxID=1463631 RepID=UPI00199F2B92|nr:hypothetical protein [Nesterenkonia alkaliphila]GFZ94384.1 hypothetical protein GCM10011359_24870 [Nesterenkonia alkaliphila]